MTYKVGLHHQNIIVFFLLIRQNITVNTYAYMFVKILELKDRLTLHRAALNGNWQDAKVLLDKKPLYAAALFGHRDKVVDLLSKTSFAKLTTEEKKGILVATITHDMCGMPLI